MSSISSINSQSARLSPLQLLQNELTSEVSAGTISSSDQDALSTALKDIDSALGSQRSSDRSGPPSPTEMKTKIDALIADQVSNGKLTSDQATELKSVFSNAFANGPGGPGGPGGAGGPGGPGGPPPGGAEQTASDGTSDSSTTSSTSSDIEALIKDFLKLLQDSKGTSASYNANGQSTSQITALLIDYQG